MRKSLIATIGIFLILTSVVFAAGETSSQRRDAAAPSANGVMLEGVSAKASPANLITVAKSGGDYDTIQAAVDAATTGTTILVYPGEYAEEVSISKAISLIGTDKTNCVIKKSVAGSGSAGDHLVTVVKGIASGVVEIRGLTMWNTYSSYSSTALMVQSPAKVSDCNIIGNEADALILNYGSGIYIEDCYISGYHDTLSINGNYPSQPEYFIRNCQIVSTRADSVDSAPIWVGNNNLTAYISNCELITYDNGGCGILIANDSGKTIKLHLANNKIRGNDGSARRLFYYASGTSTTAYIANCQYSEIGNENVTVHYLTSSAVNAIGDSTIDGDLNVTGDAGIDGDLDVQGDTELIGDFIVRSESAPDVAAMRYDKTDGILKFGIFDEGNYTWDTNLYRSAANTLKTDGTFSANQVHAGAVSWKDWAAMAGSGAFVYDKQSMALRSTADGDLQFFPIPYEAGTVLTRLRVKWQAQGSGDGVKVRLIKRDESGAESVWTVVGAQQTYADADAPYDVAVSVYDFDDETMSENHSYSIEVEGKIAAAGVKLFAVGVETSKRAF